MFRTIVISLLIHCISGIYGQNPFNCDGSTYTISSTSGDLRRMQINAGNSAVSYETISNLSRKYNAIGFRSTDNLIYGIEEGTVDMYQIDVEGNEYFYSKLDVNNTYSYEAGDFSFDGSYFVTVGSTDQGDESLFFIDFDSPSLEVSSVSLSGNTKITDIANRPGTKDWFGYDSKTRNVLRINEDQGVLTGLFILDSKDDLESVYFDPFGKLYGIGSTAFGIGHALFSIDQETGVLDQLTTGPQTFNSDATSCAYTVDIELGSNSTFVLPCTELEYTLDIANSSSQVVNNLDFSLDFPIGLEFKGIASNGLNKVVQYDGNNRRLLISDFDLYVGVSSVKFRVEVGDLEAGEYEMQGTLSGLPTEMGAILVTDNPSSNAFDDPLKVKIIQPLEDSIKIDRLLCMGERISLDASEFGNGLVWNSGSTEKQITVDKAGIYSLSSDNSCLEIYVEYDVTAATCPYTIEVHHDVLPKEFFPCSQLILRFIFENDSGFAHDNLRFRNTIPEIFTLIEVVKSPEGSTLQTSSNPLEVIVEDIILQIGFDTLDILVEVGDEKPQTLTNRGILEGLPTILGPYRESDDPTTLLFDSTYMTILGTIEDTITVEKKLCVNEDLVLDASEFGVDFLWENGSTDSINTISEIGVYELTVFDGCDPSTIYFNVTPALELSINLPPILEIDLGDSIVLDPELINEGDSLSFLWKGSDICQECLMPEVMPLVSTKYLFSANNEECADSVEVNVLVDNTRKLFIPNAFSPNGDNINDFFYIQSPDFGEIIKMCIYDRWGNQVFNSSNHNVNDENFGWNGGDYPKGVYIFVSEVKFLDDLTEIFTGSITLMR